MISIRKCGCSQMLGFLVVLLHFFVTQSTCPTGLRLLSSGTGELCPANETLDEVTCEKDAPDFFLNFTNGKIFIDNFRDLPKGCLLFENTVFFNRNKKSTSQRMNFRPICKEKCAKCPQGKRLTNDKSPQGIAKCEKCPKGRYSNFGANTCLACSAGRYSAPGSVVCFKFDTDEKCNPGEEKCKAGWERKREGQGCVECPEGKYNDEEESDCKACGVIGKYCPPKTKEPKVCEKDEFCDGITAVKRPQQPKDVSTKLLKGTDTMRVTWTVQWKSDDELRGQIAVIYSNKKFTFENANLTAQQNRVINAVMHTGDPTKYQLDIPNLNVGGRYYVRVILLQELTQTKRTQGTPSELSDVTIIPCPKGAYCGNSNGPGVPAKSTEALEGYFKVSSLVFAQCDIPKNCPGLKVDSAGEPYTINEAGENVPYKSNGTFARNYGCPKGYRGLMCLKCNDTYARQGPDCNKCKEPAGQIAVSIFFICGGTAIFGYLVYKTIKGRGHPKACHSGIMKIVLRQAQLTGIIAKIPINWGGDLQWLFSLFSTVSSAGAEAFSIDCVVKLSFFGRAAIVFFIPLMLIALFTSIVLFIYRGAGDWHFSYSRFLVVENITPRRYIIVIIVVVMTTLHPTLVKEVLGFFQCTEEINGRRYLIEDVDVVCYSANHMFHIYLMAIPVLVIYIFGLPIITFLVLWKYQEKLFVSELRQRLGYLYSGFEPKYYWWEFVVLSRLMAMAGISIFFDTNPMMQVMLGSQVLFISVFLHMVCQPYEAQILDNVEMYSLGSSALVLSSGGLLLNDTTPQAWKWIAVAFIFLSSLTFLLYGVRVYISARIEMAKRKGKDGTLEMIANPIKAIKHKVTTSVQLPQRMSIFKPPSMEKNRMSIFKPPSMEKKTSLGKVKSKTNHSSLDLKKKKFNASFDLAISETSEVSSRETDDEWTQHFDEEGDSYWYNERTRTSQWEHPYKKNESKRERFESEWT